MMSQVPRDVDASAPLGPERLDDAVLIERSWAVPEDFAAIFDRHAPTLYRYLARRVAIDDVEDLVAETFVVAFDARRRYDVSRADARPWLYGIATNLLGRHRRNGRRRARLTGLVAVRAAVDPGEQVASDLTAQSLQRDLALALSRIARRDRDVIILIAWEGLSYDEVASALAIPVGTVRSRLHRARAQLRTSLSTSVAGVNVTEVLHGE